MYNIARGLVGKGTWNQQGRLAEDQTLRQRQRRGRLWRRIDPFSLLLSTYLARHCTESPVPISPSFLTMPPRGTVSIVPVWWIRNWNWGQLSDLPNASQLRAAEPGPETSVRPQPTPSPLFLKSCKWSWRLNILRPETRKSFQKLGVWPSWSEVRQGSGSQTGWKGSRLAEVLELSGQENDSSGRAQELVFSSGRECLQIGRASCRERV